MYSLGVLSRQVIEKKEEKDWFESLDYEDLNLEGSLYMYIGGGKEWKEVFWKNLDKAYYRIILNNNHIQTNREIQMISSIRLNHVNVKQIIMINVIWLCNAWRILVKLILNYKQSTMLYQITIKHKYNCQYTLIKHKIRKHYYIQQHTWFKKKWMHTAH